jgi:hypothetical protein
MLMGIKKTKASPIHREAFIGDFRRVCRERPLFASFNYCAAIDPKRLESLVSPF